MFEDLVKELRSTFADRYLKVQVTAEPNQGPPTQGPPPRRPPPPPPQAGNDDLFAPAAATPQVERRAAPPPVSSNLGRIGAAVGNVPVVGRNDPCPCGSGKKYKKCHGATS